MNRVRTRHQTRQIHVHAETYRMLRLRAAGRDLRLLEVAEELIRVGLDVVEKREAEPATSAN